MCFEKNCYMCKYVTFFESKDTGDYFCTILDEACSAKSKGKSCDHFEEEQEE